MELEAHRLLLLREPVTAGLQRELMQPGKLIVLRCKICFDLNHSQVQLLMDGVRADGQAISLVRDCELMFHISFLLALVPEP